MSEDLGTVLTAVALLDQKMDAVQLVVKEHIGLYREDRKEHAKRIRETEEKVAVIDQRLTHTRGIFGVLQAGMIAAMTWLGVRQ